MMTSKREYHEFFQRQVSLRINIHGQHKFYPNEFPLCDVTTRDISFWHARGPKIKMRYSASFLHWYQRMKEGVAPKGASCKNGVALEGYIDGHHRMAWSNRNHQSYIDSIASGEKEKWNWRSQGPILRDRAPRKPQWTVLYKSTKHMRE